MPKVRSLDPTLDEFDRIVFFIKKKCREKKLLQKDLAEKLGYSPSQMTYLYRTRHLKVTDFWKILDIVGATPEELGGLRK